MGIRLPELVVHAKRMMMMRGPLSSPHQASTACAPKGRFAVYVGVGEKKRFVIPISYLKHPLFQALLSRAEEEFGFDHPSGGLTIPCNEDDFFHITSRLRS